MSLHPYTGREHAVPCMEIGCRRTTWRDDAYCIQHAPTFERSTDPVDEP